MDTQANDNHPMTSRTPLRQEWWAIVGMDSGLLLLGLVALASVVDRTAWMVWGATASGILIYQLIHIKLHLKENVALEKGAEAFPTLGWANWVTMLRAALLALLAGFAFIPRPHGWGAWLPGSLYIAAAMLDFFDGYIARITGRSSRLGEILDMHWDGFGVLVASWLLVHYGQVSVWFLIIGLARYLFLAGMRIREDRNLINHPLPPSMVRRAMAGVQMGFIAAVLLPVFHPPVTDIAAALFASPFLVGFARDWLYVSGILAPPSGSDRRRKLGGELIPFIARLVVCGLLMGIVARQIQSGFPLPWVFWIGVFGVAAIGAGIAGRMTALVVVLMCAFGLRFDPGANLFWLTMISGIILFFTGTGRYSLWKPEDRLIYHRAGEVDNPV